MFKRLILRVKSPACSGSSKFLRYGNTSIQYCKTRFCLQAFCFLLGSIDMSYLSNFVIACRRVTMLFNEPYCTSLFCISYFFLQVLIFVQVRSLTSRCRDNMLCMTMCERDLWLDHFRTATASRLRLYDLVRTCQERQAHATRTKSHVIDSHIKLYGRIDAHSLASRNCNIRFLEYAVKRNLDVCCFPARAGAGDMCHWVHFEISKLIYVCTSFCIIFWYRPFSSAIGVCGNIICINSISAYPFSRTQQ